MDNDVKKLFTKMQHIFLATSFVIILSEIYFFKYHEIKELNLQNESVNVFLYYLSKLGIFDSLIYPKIIVFLSIGFFIGGDTSHKDVNSKKENIKFNLAVSSLLFFGTYFLIDLPIFIYAPVLILSFLYLTKSFAKLGSLFINETLKDRYNLHNKIFKQTTELIENDTSVNIPYKFVSDYKYDRKNDSYKPILSDGYINIIAPNRATGILGKPGSGKSYSFNEEIIRQHIIKGLSMVNYDYKFPTLTNIAYNYLKEYHHNYNEIRGTDPIFAVLNLDDPKYSHRCNPISTNLITRKSEAIDAVYTIFFNIDKKSAQKPDFFLNSAMSIVSAAMWFLKLFEDGKYLSLPHLIEFISQADDVILPILDDYSELKYFTSAFSDALAKKSFNQLSGQTASARIPLGKLVTDEMFYVMCDPDGTGIDLRVNRKDNLTLLNIANNPETQKTNGPGLGLYLSQIAKLINKEDRVPCSFTVDELPTIYINGLDNLIATGRSNGVCVTLAFQDYTQLVRDYGKEIADAIFNTLGNLMIGQVAPETGKKITETIGKINYKQINTSKSHDNKISVSYSTHKDYLVESSDIAQFSQGEFVGVVCDTHKQKIETKIFKGFVSPSKEDQGDDYIPVINPDLTKEDLVNNRKRIEQEVKYILETEKNRMLHEKEMKKREEQQAQIDDIQEWEANNAANSEEDYDLNQEEPDYTPEKIEYDNVDSDDNDDTKDINDFSFL